MLYYLAFTTEALRFKNAWVSVKRIWKMLDESDADYEDTASQKLLSDRSDKKITCEFVGDI